MSTQWTAADVPQLDGRTVVVTGANSGIGYEGSGVFADRGATVVMACRSVRRGERAANRIRREVGDADLDVRELDLADLSSVAAFAEGFAADYDELHVLCNNAGVMAIPRDETADGFEMQFGVNHLGHFALTGHLLDVLEATEGESRVVTQSSGVHEQGKMDFESLAPRAEETANGEAVSGDLQHERDYDKWDAYAQSKLANVLFGYELDRRLRNYGVEDVRSVVCHPGFAATNLQIRTGQESGSTLRLWAMKAANALFAQSAEMGALPMLFAATDDRVLGGEYVGPGGFMNMRGHPEFQRSSDRSYDEATAERLWDVSEELTGVEYDFDGR